MRIRATRRKTTTLRNRYRTRDSKIAPLAGGGVTYCADPHATFHYAHLIDAGCRWIEGALCGSFPYAC
jgi:hypothetical protein